MTINRKCTNQSILQLVLETQGKLSITHKSLRERESAHEVGALNPLLVINNKEKNAYVNI
jgi:hypothetical protein